jgi:hypothetical protein
MFESPMQRNFTKMLRVISFECLEQNVYTSAYWLQPPPSLTYAASTVSIIHKVNVVYKLLHHVCAYPMLEKVISQQLKHYKLFVGFQRQKLYVTKETHWQSKPQNGFPWTLVRYFFSAFVEHEFYSPCTQQLLILNLSSTHICKIHLNVIIPPSPTSLSSSQIFYTRKFRKCMYNLPALVHLRQLV